MERKTGAYALLQSASIYQWFQASVYSSRARDCVVNQINAQPGDRVFDIGCGPGYILDMLPPVDYLGIDYSPDYIESARANYGTRGRFICAGVDDAHLGDEAGTFDVVVAKGVVHHLDDGLAASLFKLARRALKPGGHLTTLDPCFIEGQSWLARQVVSRDRGQFVRTVEAYRDLAANGFEKIETTVEHKLLRIPYTLLFMTCIA